MTEPKPVALVDMDGTLCNFRGALDRDLRAALGEDYDKVSDRTRRRLELTLRQREGWYLELEPLPLGFLIVDELRKAGFEVMILTKGNPRALNAWSEKIAWVKRYLPGTDQITITTDKGLVYGKVLVDDYISYVNRWLEWRPRGLVLMPDQSWNQGFSHTQVIRIANASDLAAARPMLKEAAERRP